MTHASTSEVVPEADADFARPLADAETEEALGCAAAAARRFWLSRSGFRASVLGVDARVETYQRALHIFERRTVSRQTSPGGDRRAMQPAPDPAGVDPWSVDPSTIEGDTRVTAVCPTCDGATRVTCGNCDGTTRARCSNCGGSGKTLSQRKGQLYKKCPQCRGNGTQKCMQCRGGLVPCSPCAATGVLTAWLSLERTTIAQVQVHPRNAAAAVHRAVDAPADLDATGFVNAIVADTGAQSQLPPTPRELHPVINPRSDRMISSRLQTFSSKVHRVSFTTALAPGHVEVAGRPPTVANSSNWDGLRWRRSTILTTLVVGVGAAIVVWYEYLARHGWFAKHGDALLVFALACSAAAAIAWTVAAITNSPRARARVAYAAAGLAATCVAATAVAFVHTRPSARSARAALAFSALDDARDEARAMIDLGGDRADGEAILDEVQSRRVAAATTCHQMASLADYSWHSDTRRADTVQRIQLCTNRESTAAYERGDERALEQLAADVSSLARAEQSGARWLAAVLHACTSLASDDLSAATKSLDDLISLAANVPEPMRPTTFPQLTGAASALRQNLAAAQTGNARAQRQALTLAIDQTKAFVALTPLRDTDSSAPLARRLDKIRKQIARADRKAATRNDENQATASPDSAPREQPEPKGEIMNPY